MTLPTAVVSFSGGMDSTTLLWHVKKTHTPIALSFDYGQRHVKELDAARDITQHYGIEHHVIDLRSVGALLTGSALTDGSVPVPEGHYEAETMKATVVPNRNAIMATIAVGIASARGAEFVALGVHAGDHAVYPDCRPQFVGMLRALTGVALEGFHTPQIHTPFVTWTKANIAEAAIEMGAPLGMSWSCYKGGEIHCGRCSTCVERREAMALAGVSDPTQYLDMEYAWEVLA